MVEITLIEFHAEDGSFSANLPFSGLTDDTDTEEISDADDEDAGAVADDSGGSKGKGLAVLGVFLFLIVAAVAVKYLTGGDAQPDVDIDTEDVPSVDVAAGE